MNAGFPPYTVENGVATITAKARNGYPHLIRVPTDGSGRYATDALAFLMAVHPFEVKGSDGRKKLYRNGRHLAEVWAHFRYQYASNPIVGRVRCRDHNWLNWVDNIYFTTTDKHDNYRRQSNFEGRIAAVSNSLTERELELLHAGPRPIDIPFGTDAAVADIFREVRQLPARSSRAFSPDEMPPKRDKLFFDWEKAKFN